MTDGELSFALFSYGDIQWDDGAFIGFESAIICFDITKSSKFNTLELETTSNVGIPGLYIFRVDQTEVIEPIINETGNFYSSFFFFSINYFFIILYIIASVTTEVENQNNTTDTENGSNTTEADESDTTEEDMNTTTDTSGCSSASQNIYFVLMGSCAIFFIYGVNLVE